MGFQLGMLYLRVVALVPGSAGARGGDKADGRWRQSGLGGTVWIERVGDQPGWR